MDDASAIAQPVHRPAWSRVRRLLYPGLLTAAVVGAWLLLRRGVAPEGAAAAAVVAAAIVVWSLELLRPHLVAWRPPGRTLLLDVVHTAVSSLVSPLVKAGITLLLAAAVQPHVGLELWPTHWPLALQIPLAIVVGDLGIYLGHRLMHVTRTGWRLHAVHHSPTRLHFWASARSHPFNVVVKITLESGVLLLLGIGSDAYALWLVFMSVNGLLQHANVDLRTGVLGRVLATPEVHRVHHSTDMELGNSNFGNTTVIWDRLFGTYRLPPEPTTEVGLAGCEIPERYGVHLLVPFVLGRLERATTERHDAVD